MYTFRELKSTHDSLVEEFGAVDGKRRFVGMIHEAVGVRKRNKDTGELLESVDDVGRKVIQPNSVNASTFSLRLLAEAIGGRDFVESFNPNASGRSDMVELMEAGPGLDPTAMLNINAFNSAASGLIEVKMLEGYQNNAFIGDQLFETVPTRLNGEKMIGTYGFQATDGDGIRKPGQPHGRAQFGERWVSTPELEEKALAVEITQEAVFYDLTNEVLQQAAGVGDILGYGREKTMLRLFAGATNAYNYKGVAYNTYQTATPWINDHANAASDYNDIDEALALFENMTDPETGREIMVVPDTIVHMPRKKSLWHRILNSIEQRETTNSSTVTIASAPPSASGYNTLDSTILRNIIDEELGVSQTQANDWWFIGQPKKCYKWMEAWPLRVRQASPNEFVMLDRGLVAAYFGNYRGAGAVVEPRYMVRNKN